MSGFPKYPRMKDSGVEWLGEVPEHWEVRRLKTLVKIQKRIAGHTDYPILSITQQGIKEKDIKSGEGQLALDYSKYQIVEPGDFAMNHMDLLTGFVDLSEQLGVTSPDYRVFSLAEKNFDSRFLLKLMQMGYHQRLFYSLGQGSAQLGRWRLSKDEFYNFHFPTPPLPEQKAIATFLDRETTRIDTLVKEQEEMIELLKEKRQAVISQAVTRGLDPDVPMKDSGVEWLGEVPEHWEVKRLKNLVQLELSNVDKHTVDGQPKVELCNYTDVYKNESITTDINFMKSTASEEQIKRLSLSMGDTVITKDSEDPSDIGVPAYIEGTKNGLVCGYHLAILRPMEFAFGRYIFWLIMSTGIKRYFHSVARGMTRYALGKMEICETPSILPPLPEQKAIATFLDRETTRIDNLITEAQEAIELMKEHRQSLISEAVTGKIDVRGIKLS